MLRRRGGGGGRGKGAAFEFFDQIPDPWNWKIVHI